MGLAALVCVLIPLALLLYYRKKGADILPFFVGCGVFVVFAYYVKTELNPKLKVTLEDVNKWLEEWDSMGDVVSTASKILAAAMKRPMPVDGPDEEAEKAGNDDWDEDEENPTETTSR